MGEMTEAVLSTLTSLRIANAAATSRLSMLLMIPHTEAEYQRGIREALEVLSVEPVTPGQRKHPRPQIEEDDVVEIVDLRDHRNKRVHTLHEVRRWALEHGVDVGSRGRISQSVLRAYKRAKEL